MSRNVTALLFLVLAMTAPATATALELGVQDDGQLHTNPAALTTAADDLGATWIRMIFRVGDPAGPSRIRDAHAHGFKVLVTIGGTGTPTPKPTARALLRYLRTLPQADRYTVINEPDLTGIKACTYRRTWMAVRRILGRKLLFGDFSPYAPVTMTAAIRKCGSIPKHLAFALHPYQRNDPLTRGADEGSLGNLRTMRRNLRRMGLTVDLWLDEFGYLYDGPQSFLVTDQQAAAMWPRAKTAAIRAHAKMLSVYMAQGPTWDSRPRELAWATLTGRMPAPALEPTGDPTPFPGYY